MAEIKNIFLHCSDSAWGDAMTIDSWHRRRGWPCIGYHFVILNGYVTSDTRWEFLDGAIQPGHVLDEDSIMEPREIGYHVAGRNHDSVGVCLIGTIAFTTKQLQSAYTVCHQLMSQFALPVDAVLGHYEHLGAGKTCPNIPMPTFREYLRGEITLLDLQKAIGPRRLH